MLFLTTCIYLACLCIMFNSCSSVLQSQNASCFIYLQVMHAAFPWTCGLSSSSSHPNTYKCSLHHFTSVSNCFMHNINMSLLINDTGNRNVSGFRAVLHAALSTYWNEMQYLNSFCALVSLDWGSKCRVKLKLNPEFLLYMMEVSKQTNLGPAYSQ